MATMMSTVTVLCCGSSGTVLVSVCMSGECGCVENIDSSGQRNKWRSVTATDSPPWRQLYRGGRKKTGKNGLTLFPIFFFCSMTRVCAADRAGCSRSFLRHQQRAVLPCPLLKGTDEFQNIMFKFWLTDCDYWAWRRRHHYVSFLFPIPGWR